MSRGEEGSHSHCRYHDHRARTCYELAAGGSAGFRSNLVDRDVEVAFPPGNERSGRDVELVDVDVMCCNDAPASVWPGECVWTDLWTPLGIRMHDELFTGLSEMSRSTSRHSPKSQIIVTKRSPLGANPDTTDNDWDV